MTALITYDEARHTLGISKRALTAAVDRGDLIQVEMEGIRGTTRKLITSASIEAWVAKLNGKDKEDPQPPPPHNDKHNAIERRICELSHQICILTEKVDQAIQKIVPRQDQIRRTRLRHTVSARIGDAFDPSGYYVYLLWSDDDELPIYIGKSQNVLNRLGSHMADKDKRHMVRSIQLIKCAGEATMNRTEAALIREYCPILNIVGVPHQKSYELRITAERNNGQDL
jgi:predicted GIY-YIG superfamily endonuclease